MKKSLKHNYFALLVLNCILVFASCNSGNNTPYRYKVTTTFTRDNSNQTVTLQDSEHRVKVIDELGLAPNKIFLTSEILSGNGIQPANGWIAMAYKQNISVSGGGGISASTSVGNYNWLRLHSSTLMTASELSGWGLYTSDFGYQRTDSVIDDEPGLHLFGSAYFIKIKDLDDHIPWHHEDVHDATINPQCILDNTNTNVKCLDMENLTKTLFDGMVTTVTDITNADHFPLGIALGGSGNDGDFELHFIPRLQYKVNSSSTEDRKIQTPGMGLYFTCKVKVSMGVPLFDARIVIPILIMFTRNNTTRNFSIAILPFQDMLLGSSSPEGLDKILVTASTPFGAGSREAATQVRSIIIDTLTKRSTGTYPAAIDFQSRIIGGSVGLNLGINKYLKNPNQAFPSVEALNKFDIVLVPSDCASDRTPMCFNYHGFYTSRVQPEDQTSTKVMAVIIDDGF